MKRILAAIFLILAASGLIAVVTPRLPEAQTHTFPALDTNNVFTGTNTFPTIISGTANPAAAAFLRLASGDQVNWRNTTNTSDLTFGIVQTSGNRPADTLAYQSSSAAHGIDAGFFMINGVDASVAAGGHFRMHSTDTLNWRNNANNADISLSKNASDQLLFSGGKVVSQSGAIVAGHLATYAADASIQDGGIVPIVPSIPYKIECINTTPVTVTNTATETILMSCSIPANELGNNQTLRLHASGTNLTAAVQTLTMRVRIGGLAGTQLGVSDVAIANSSGGSWNLNFTITANGAPSGATATECQGMFVENNGTSTPLGTTLSNSAPISWATNSTLSLVITQAWSAAVTATFTERELIVERLN